MCSLAQYGSALTLAMAKDLGNVSALKSPMTHVEQLEDGVRVTAGERVIDAAHLVVAMPPLPLRKVTFVPPLPTELAEMVSALELGPATKVISEYQRRFWEPLGLSETRRSSLLRHAFSSSKHRWIRCTQRESLNEPVTPRRSLGETNRTQEVARPCTSQVNISALGLRCGAVHHGFDSQGSTPRSSPDTWKARSALVIASPKNSERPSFRPAFLAWLIYDQGRAAVSSSSLPRVSGTNSRIRSIARRGPSAVVCTAAP